MHQYDVWTLNINGLHPNIQNERTEFYDKYEIFAQMKQLRKESVETWK